MVAPGRRRAFVVDLEHREVRHETCRSRTVPVFLERLEEDAIAGPDHLDRAASLLCQAHALGDVDRLTVRMRMPGRAGARREVDAASTHPRTAAGRCDRVDV